MSAAQPKVPTYCRIGYSVRLIHLCACVDVVRINPMVVDLSLLFQPRTSAVPIRGPQLAWHHAFKLAAVVLYCVVYCGEVVSHDQFIED